MMKIVEAFFALSGHAIEEENEMKMGLDRIQPQSKFENDKQHGCP